MLRTDIITAKIQEYKNPIKFSHVLRLSTINKGTRVIIPFNPNKWVKQFFSKKKSCFIICPDEQNNLNIHIPIEEKVKDNNNTQEIAIDKGFRTLLVDSNKQMYGENWTDIEQKLDDKFQ